MNEQGLENPSDYNWEVQDDDATDYVFPLSCYELDHLYSVAEGRIKHGVEFSFSEGVRPIYWTRSNVSKFLSMSDNNSIDGVKAVTCWTGYYDFMMKSYCSWSGTEVSDPPEEPFIGVSPAMNVDISNVALTTKKGVSHTSQMTDNPVGKSSNHHLVMSLPDGNDEYQAIRLDDKIISSEEGGKIQLEVSGETSTSDQITGMIINSNQDIIYFGKIGNVGEGKYEVSIPGGLPVGDYVLKSFSEENISDNATSYVSNMQDVSFQVRNQLKDVTLSETTFIRDDSEKGPVVTVKYNNKVLTEGTDYEISGTKRATKASGKEGYTLTVTGIGDYYGQVEKKWWIKNPPMDGKITADPVQSVYDGENHEIHVDIDSSIENPSIQYSLDGENFDTEMPVCKNVVVNEDGSIGSYKIYYKVSEDDYEDYIGSTTLTIEPKEITLVWGENNLVYNGKKQAPSATAKGLIDGDTCDVIVSGMQKDSNQKTGESVYTAAAESLTNKNYILPKENKEEFYIQPKIIDISWENELVYNGKEQKASAKVVGLEEGDEAEIGTESYDTGSGEKVLAVNAGTYEAKAVSISNANYQLPQDCVSDFKIIPKALIDPSVHVTLTGDGISYEEKNNAYIFEWDGKEKTPEVQLTDDQTGEVIVLKRGIDYTISGDQMEDEVGDYTIVLTGKGNYGTGIRSHKRKIVWKIAKAVINPALVMENWTYGEKASDPKIGLEDNNASVTYTYYLDKECTQKTSEADGASVAGGKPSNAGENPGDYKITVTLDGEQNQNYSIEFKPGIFQIQPHNWPDNWITIKAATENEEGKREKTCQYDGCAQKKYDIIPAENTPEDPAAGELEKDVEIAADAPIQDATLHNKKMELINDSGIFGEDEKQWILNGESARVWLEITKADMSDISDSDKGSVLAAAQQIMGENPRITYFNIDMFKQISGKQSFQLHETQNMMKIAIKLPEELLNQDTTMLRYYKIIRLHEGKVDIIDGSFDEKLNELSFETNKFSVYALAYRDLPHATAVTVTSEKTTLTKELETAQLSVRIDPDNAAEQNVVWISSDDSIATVDADGKVTARAKGKVTITAKTENGITGTISLVIDIADIVTSQPATEVPSESPTIQPATEVPSESPTIQPATEVPSESPTIQPATEIPAGSPTTQPANIVDVSQNVPTVVVTKSSVTTVSKTQLEKNALALNAKLKVSQVKRQINICWGKVKGASGYDVYVQYCGQKFTSKSLNQVKKGNVTRIVIKKVNGEKLDLKKNYKIYVLAYKMKGEQKIVLGKTITAHIVGRKNDKNTNVKEITLEQKNITLDAGKKAVVHASTILVDSDKEPLSNAHAKELRFASTNKKVAYVSVKGEIKALKKGSCVVYVYARNGYAQKVNVTVK